MSVIASKFIYKPARLPFGLKQDSSPAVVLRPTEFERVIRLGMPAFVRRFDQPRLGDQWQSFCGLMHEFAIALGCPLQDMLQIPAALIPVRIGKRTNDQSFVPDELMAADLLELVFCHEGRWAWPAEVSSAEELTNLVHSARQATAGDTMIGAVLPLQTCSQDLAMAIDAGVDFLTLEDASGTSIDERTLKHIAIARQTCIQAKRPNLSLMIDVPVNSTEEFLLCLAMGASTVCIDNLLAAHIVEEPVESVSSGMLSGITVGSPPSQKPPLEPVRQQLVELSETLVERLAWCGCTDPSSFGKDCLQTTSEQLARSIEISLL